jgi:hypothetical protein
MCETPANVSHDHESIDDRECDIKINPELNIFQFFE